MSNLLFINGPGTVRVITLGARETMRNDVDATPLFALRHLLEDAPSGATPADVMTGFMYDIASVASHGTQADSMRAHIGATALCLTAILRHALKDKHNDPQFRADLQMLVADYAQELGIAEQLVHFDAERATSIIDEATSELAKTKAAVVAAHKAAEMSQDLPPEVKDALSELGIDLNNPKVQVMQLTKEIAQKAVKNMSEEQRQDLISIMRVQTIVAFESAILDSARRINSDCKDAGISGVDVLGNMTTYIINVDNDPCPGCGEHHTVMKGVVHANKTQAQDPVFVAKQNPDALIARLRAATDQIFSSRIKEANNCTKH